MSTEEPQTHWQSLLVRLAKVSESLDDTHRQSDARMRAVLDARAKEMAVAQQRDRRSESGIEVVMFRLASQRCGIPTSFVFEVLPLPLCTRLPATQPHILGLCSLRGQILLAVDLARLFDLTTPSTTAAVEPQLIILGTERPEIGVLSHGDCQTAFIATDAVFSSADLAALPIGTCVHGMTSDGLLLFDGQALLNHTSLYVNQTGDERQA